MILSYKKGLEYYISIFSYGMKGEGLRRKKIIIYNKLKKEINKKEKSRR